MPEARDRIVRPVDYSAIFANRRSNGILLDVPESELRLIQSPVLRIPSDSPGPGSVGRGSLVRTGGGVARGNFSTWRPGNGRAGHTPFRLAEGRENMPLVATRGGRGRASRSQLPSWYPRTPLSDITHIMRAIERRRAAGTRADEGRDVEIPTHQQVGVLESPVPLSRGEHKCSMETPGPSLGIKRSCPPSTARVHKMLLNITKEIAEEEEGFITPEKKLLNSIDKVEKIVMKEIRKLQCTPQAKREEREKRVRTLMSMR
ncbi:PREDICTED: protein GIGAS CELL1-like [Camelina sativa]|uniref:Protein GIGAS CELL1-like n=1 Tax=Camelina sativa TaxID=90675 RepID=A0ABM0TKC5_CAMSA|nr:PREDICTED: protein GIGAS CELL1-like [Camelina sativa]